MAKRTTRTEVVTKALARSGPELTPSQIRLDDSVQTDASKVFTQSDVNQSIGSGGGGGGGGGGGIAPDLDGYAKTEYVDAGDAALDGKIAAVAKDLDVVENDYTTTAEFNTLNSKVTQNKKDIASLGDAFDTAVLAAQDGAEALEIELQSYVKKEDLPEGADLSEYAKTEYVDSADAALNDLIAANTKAIEDLPSGSSVRYPIKEVLAEGNVAEAGQSLHFRVSEGKLPPFKRDAINIEGGSGLRLGGVVSTYSLNEPFEIDTEHGVTMPFDSSVNRISGADIYIYGNHPKLDGRVIEASIGLNGITYSGTTTSLDIEPDYVRFAVGEYLKEHFKIVAGSDSSSVKASELETDKFIAGQDFRNGDLSDVGVEIDGQKGIIHLKGRNGTVTPIEVFESGSNVQNVSASVFKVSNDGVCTAESFVGDGSKLTNLPHTGGCQSLPGQKWNMVTPHALPPSPGEMMWVDGDNALYCHATTADGNVLGNATTDFSIYNVNGTVILSAYKQGVGIEAIFKAATVEMITTSGQTYWKFIKTDHGRFNLIEGQSYNVTASGMF